MSSQTAALTPPAQFEPEPFVDPDTAARYLRSTRRHVLEMVRAGLIVGHPLDPRSKKKDWRLLRDCDVIFGCVDTYRDRHELEITARRYLVPYIDIGMDVRSIGDEFSVSGQVILSMPGALCLRCLGFLRDDLLAKEAENYGAAGDRPQVVWANGVLASIAVGVFTQLLTPWHATHTPTVYLEYDGNAQTVGISRRLEYMEGRKCSHFSHLHDLGDPFWVPKKVG
jgi:hypothetical protein